MMSTNFGKVLENRIKRWHNDIDCLTFKFPDYASAGSYQNAWCDRVTVTSKGVFWFECKHTNSKTSFSFGLIKPHQWSTMLLLESYQNSAYFIIEDGNKNIYFITPSELRAFEGKSVKFTKLAKYMIKKSQFLRIVP